MTGKEIKELLKQHNASLTEVANSGGITRQNLNTRLGRRKITASTAKIVADFLKVPITDITKSVEIQLVSKKSTFAIAGSESINEYKEKYYNCLEESGKLKDRIIALLDENRELKSKPIGYQL